MNQWHRINSILLTLLMATTLSCGEEADSESSNVEIQYRAFKVIKSGFTYDINPNNDTVDDTITVDGPYFQFLYFGKNSSNTTLVISSFTAEVTGTTSTGQSQTVEWVPDIIGGNAVNVVAAGESFESPMVFIDGLPESNNPSYRVRVELEGYFLGAENDPDTSIDETQLPGANFSKSFSFRVDSN